MAYFRGRCLLQHWLDLRGMSQAELARRSGWSERNPEGGWSPKMISHFCTNRKSLSVEAIYTFSIILEIPNPLDALYDEWNWNGSGEGPQERDS